MGDALIVIGKGFESRCSLHYTSENKQRVSRKQNIALIMSRLISLVQASECIHARVVMCNTCIVI